MTLEKLAATDPSLPRDLPTPAVHVRKKEIEVNVGSATGWDQGSFREPIGEGDSGLLLPWATVKRRTYRYDHGAFSKADEIAQAGASGPAKIFSAAAAMLAASCTCGSAACGRVARRKSSLCTSNACPVAVLMSGMPNPTEPHISDKPRTATVASTPAKNIYVCRFVID